MIDKKNIRRALISVSDKTGIAMLAKALQIRGVSILSTGGTAELLQKEGIPVQEVSHYTGFPEIMDGRVKTLHPKIHAALLGRHEIDDHVMKEHGIDPIDLLIVNLYPFDKTIEKENCPLEDAVEQIDIGGPAMIRAAAKNYACLTVLTDSKDYQSLLDEIDNHAGKTTLNMRFNMAKKAFAHTALYDSIIANYLNSIRPDNTIQEFPDVLTLQFHKKQDLRYGENPHQKAALYMEIDPPKTSIVKTHQHQGKSLSFNNIVDANAALECIKLFGNTQACVIVKHANPCGVALAETQLEAYQRAFSTDPNSAFGGIIALNKLVTAKTAKAIVENQFLEILIAPSFDQEALSVFSQKPNIRVLSCGKLEENKSSLDYNRIMGGLLVQEQDTVVVSPKDLTVVSARGPTVQEFNDLLFAWEVVKCVKSNAIVYVKEQATVGIGAGQMSRAFSAMIASMKAADARLEVKGSVMASDAFFPFRDSIEIAAKTGVTAIIQPGGSIRDHEVIQTANEHNIAMVFTHIRHFKH